MLKAVVGVPDSSEMVKAKVQSGPTLPDTFIFSDSLTGSPKPAPQIISPNSALQPPRESPISKKECIEKYLNDVSLENARNDVKRSIRHVKRIKMLYTYKEVAKFRKACAEYLSN